MEPDVGQHSAAVRGAISALLGGVTAWVAAFSGLGLWGLVIGLALTAIVILAFVLLSWPLLWLLVGYIRYAISGQPLGD